MTTNEVKRLDALMELALEEAIYEGRHLGLAIARTGYGFRVYEGKLWLPLDEDGLLRERDWPDELHVALELEGKRVVLPKSLPDKPQVFILASGEMSPFRLMVEFGRDPDTQAVVNGNIVGRLWVQLPGEEPEEVSKEEETAKLSVPTLQGKDKSTRRE
jgi:general secretion pathway protein H